MQSSVGHRSSGGCCEHNQQQVPYISVALCSKQSLQLQWSIGCQLSCQAGRPSTQSRQKYSVVSAGLSNRYHPKTYYAHMQLMPSAASPWHWKSHTLYLQTLPTQSSLRQSSITSNMCPGTLHRPAITASALHASPASSPSSYSVSSIFPTELLPHPEATDSYQQLLCDVFHIPPSDAQLLLLTNPAVVTLTPSQLKTNWTKLQQLLPVKPHMLLTVLLQLPGLLLNPKKTVFSRLQEASEVLQRPVHSLRSRQHKLTPLLHWHLLRMERQQLAARLAQLEQLLGFQQQQSSHQQHQQQPHQQQLGQSRQQAQLRWQMQHIVALICDEPRLLNADQAQLVSSVEAIEEACSWPIARLLPGLLTRPQLLMRSADQLYAAATALQQQLKLSEEGLALVLKRAPGALLASSEQLTALLAVLSSSLAVPTEVAVDICLQEPQLLLRRPGAVGRVLAVLQSASKLTPEELLQVVEFDPSVLCRSAGELAVSCGKFRELAHSNRAWAVEYKRLMSKPVNVARALRIEPLRLQRLVYLQQEKRTRTASLKAAVSMSGRQFSLAYPGYKRWLTANYSSGGVPRQ